MAKKYTIEYGKSFIGKKYNSLLVLDYVQIQDHNKSYFLCKCDCGSEKLYRSHKVIRGEVKTCGCLNGRRNPIAHNLSRTKVYCVWGTMINRCYNPNSEKYYMYGGRGITVCDEWRKDFLSFYSWALSNGYKEGLSIDRIDNNKAYSPENCRWATPKQQSRNTRANRYITYKGEKKLFIEWCETLNLPYKTIYSRLCDWGEENIDKVFEYPIKRKD